jgi:hypothetical protein
LGFGLFSCVVGLFSALEKQWTWLHGRLSQMPPQNQGPVRHRLKAKVWLNTVEAFPSSQKRSLLLEALKKGLCIPFRDRESTWPQVRQRFGSSQEDLVTQARWILKELEAEGVIELADDPTHKLAKVARIRTDDAARGLQAATGSAVAAVDERLRSQIGKRKMDGLKAALDANWGPTSG